MQKCCQFSCIQFGMLLREKHWHHCMSLVMRSCNPQSNSHHVKMRGKGCLSYLWEENWWIVTTYHRVQKSETSDWSTLELQFCTFWGSEPTIWLTGELVWWVEMSLNHTNKKEILVPGKCVSQKCLAFTSVTFVWSPAPTPLLLSHQSINISKFPPMYMYWNGWYKQSIHSH